jgi:hypothetical protein
MLRPAFWLLVASLGVGASAAQSSGAAAIGDALKGAVDRALPFPEARSDGTPPGGATEPIWLVRWPAGDEARVDVLANPLNPGNRDRALKAEAEIQKAVMASQRVSQGDYEQAVSDFQRTGKVGEIREVSLNDEGVAGERYDAESQLTIRAQVFGGRHTVTIPTSRRPEAGAETAAGAAVVRVPANTYLEPATADTPSLTRFCPEQAWIFFGATAPPAIASTDESTATVEAAPAPGTGRIIVISITGNAELVDRVLQQSDWASFRARLAG